jgi:hypothetical protein
MKTQMAKKSHKKVEVDYEDRISFVIDPDAEPIDFHAIIAQLLLEFVQDKENNAHEKNENENE